MSLSIEGAELPSDAVPGKTSDITLTLSNLAPASSQTETAVTLEPANLQARMSGPKTLTLEKTDSAWLSDESLHLLAERYEGTYLATFPLAIPASAGSFLYAYYPKQTLTNRYTGEQETVAAGSVIQFTLIVTPDSRATISST